MDKNMRNKSQLNPAQQIAADLWIVFFAQHFNVPPQNVAFAESVIRIDDFRALLDAVYSGLKVSASVVDRAVECIEKKRTRHKLRFQIYHTTKKKCRGNKITR
ncbi:MAG: hypothetical protein L6U16_02290 [Porphyromonadaceae bacterium]|nr:MAG: hypothetical protein L6U16_02290 [Porphyromonadaceae bacterium]